MQCYFCSRPCANRVCLDCLTLCQPSFRLMPSLPNICLGGYLYGYNPVIRYMLHEVKFRFNFGLARLFRDYLKSFVLPGIFLDSDAIVCVRSHWFRQLFRGPSHLNYLFQPMIGDHVLSNYLVRSRYSRSSYRLSKKEREQALYFRRFRWDGPDEIHSVTVLDDICTSGSTLIEIARLLKSHGIDTVKVLVLSYVDTTTIKSSLK